MYQAKNITQSTIEMSPEELAACRKQLKERWSSRKPDQELLQRAWKTAYEIAQLLYDEFNATHVAVFGSLSEPLGFTEASDIDIAVSGLSEKTHSRANSKVMDLKTGFKIDLINFDTTKGLFRQRVQQQTIHIKKGQSPTKWKTIYKHIYRQDTPIIAEEIYEVNRKKLTQRIDDECVKIESTVTSIVKALEDIKIAPDTYQQYIEETITTRLTDVYMGLERIFERIANEVDEHLPRGSRWHKDLLEQMAKQRPERQPVISQDALRLLTPLLEFRHKVNNIYADELIYENTEEHAKNIERLFQIVSDDLNLFTISLVQRKEDNKKE